MRDAEPIPVPIDRGRLERCVGELALVVAAGRMSERAFLAATRRLNSEDARLVEHARPPSPMTVKDLVAGSVDRLAAV